MLRKKTFLIKHLKSHVTTEEKKKKAFVLMLGLHDQNCHCSAPRAAKVQNRPICFLQGAALCRHPKALQICGHCSNQENTKTSQHQHPTTHTHLTLLSHSCLTIAKQSRSLCFPTFWLDTMAPAALGLGWGSWSRPALMS